MNLLVISGSPRKFGRSGIVARYISKKYNAKMIDLSQNELPFFNGESDQDTLDSVKQLKKSVMEADGVILISPEYHGALSGALKNALDFLGSSHFHHKPVALLAVSGGGKGGINALSNMRIVARALYANIIPKQLVLDPIHFDRENDSLINEADGRVDELIAELDYYVKMAQAIKK